MTDDVLMRKKAEAPKGSSGYEAMRGMAVLEIAADVSYLHDVQDFVMAQLKSVHCSEKTMMSLYIIVEEIFINIANYAYASPPGKVRVAAGLTDDRSALVMMFIDEGTHYNPLTKEDPDVTAEAADRNIGGLGVLMVKKMSDRMTYNYQNGQNVLTITKKLED